MKKILIIALATIMAVFCFSLGSSAAEPSFKVDISGATAVAAGDTVKYTVEVKDINVPSPNTDEYDSGLASVTVFVKYDTAFFDGSSVSVKMPDLPSDVWGTSLKQPSDGVIKIEVWSEPDSEGKNPTANANGILEFEISIKVKSSAVEGGGKEIYIGTDTEGGDANLDIISNVTCGSLDVSLIKKLDKPTGAEISSDYKAKWNSVPNATSYQIQVYKDGQKLGQSLSSTGTNYDLSTLIKKNLGGAYTFTVVAKSSSALYTDSDEATSSALNYRGRLNTPTIALTVDKIAGVVKYKITDTNPDDTVGTYIITVYDKDGHQVGDDIVSTKLEGTIKNLEFGVKYGVTVIANSSSLDNTETGNYSSYESAKSEVTPDGIIGISVTKKPNLDYKEGDTIDLSSMEVTVDFAVAANVKVKKADFSKYGITVNPKHGADAILSLNGKNMTVTCGTLTADEELTITVKKGQCEHTSTEPEHQDPTCGVDGFDRLVCSLCGQPVDETVLPATGEHQFSDWEWKGKPTVSVDGVRERTCSICGKVERQTVTYAEYLAMQSGTTTTPPATTPSVTDKPQTAPPETTERRKGSALGGIDDLGKIFLFALIAVLAVIVIFVVSAVYIESRRNRRKRSHSRTNQSRNGQGRGGRGSGPNSRNNYRR